MGAGANRHRFAGSVRALVRTCALCAIAWPTLAAQSTPLPADLPTTFNQAIRHFHEMEMQRGDAGDYLAYLSAVDTRFAAKDKQRSVLINAERCEYVDFANASAATMYIASGIDRAKRERMPIAENMFRLCELTLQSEELDMAGLDGVIARFNALEAPYQKAKALWLRADVNSVRGNIADALLDFQRARAAFERAGVSGTQPNMLARESIAKRRMGDLQGAEVTMRSVLDVWKAANNPRESAYAYIQIGFIQMEAGDPGSALDSMASALMEAHRAQDADIQRNALTGLAFAQVRSGEWLAALDAIERARSLARPGAPQDTFDTAMLYYVEGMALAGNAKFEPGMAALDSALKLFERQKNNRLVALVLRAKADALAADRQFEPALVLYRHYMQMEASLQKKMRIEQGTLLRQEFEIQSQAFETRQLRVNRLAQQHQLEILQSTRKWQGLALITSLALMCFLTYFAWRQWRQGRQLNVLANVDPLTHVANRNGVERFADVEMRVAEETHRPLSMLMLDIDHFKKVNDTFGHLVGDLVLQEATRIWSTGLRANDLLGRFGGEEFLAICPGLDLEAAGQVAERLRTAVGALRLSAIDPDLSITVSIGVAQYVPGESRNAWIERADRALYTAKEKGRNCVVLSDAVA